jgi:UDP-4-amino-4-deoxy-L-arabinose formyltransferase/UDP-glucuronic acid dehydrogenase (UDP-4-keto-hexauronic acid decarboxylating)
VADYCDIVNASLPFEIKVYQAKTYSLKHADDIAFIQSIAPTAGFTIGWQRLLPTAVLNCFREGVFGMHGSAADLPFGRGRSPMNWAIIEGRKQFYTNLFRLKEGVDDGEILGTLVFPITEKDTGKTMHYKNTLAMVQLVLQHLPSVLDGSYTLMAQKVGSPTFYPRRYESDSLLDFTKDIVYLERFIRAVTRPFNGAFAFVDGKKISIYAAQIFAEEAFVFPGVVIGEVVEVFSENEFLLQLQGGTLLITDYCADFILQKGMVLNTNGLMPRVFPLNACGGYDLP